MKYLDNFLKKLKTDRNTFFTYILTLISFYLCIDRVVEIIFIASTGMSVDLWGPIKYTFAILCVSFAYHFSCSSKFAKHDWVKLSHLYIHIIGLYILGISLVIQWVNTLCWLAFFCVPNYSTIIINFKELIRPAFSAFAWYLPTISFYPLFKTLYIKFHDTKDIRDSIFDYGGIDLSDQTKGWGPYTCEMFLCKDSETGKAIKIPESRRYEATLVVGVSGAGKTSMIFEPMIARDIEKKHFLREASKEMGYTALRTGLANLNSPYSNKFINENFNLNMLTPVEGKEKLYKAYMSKLILSSENNNLVYRNLGFTYVAPDFETISNIKEVLKNFGIKYHIIDPTDPESEGLNPFIFNDPVKTSIAISSVLKRMYETETETTSASFTDTFMQNIATQAIENLTLLLYETYHMEHDDDLPTLEDLLKLLYNFEEIERLTNKLESNPELAKKYDMQIRYFKTTFFSDNPNINETQKQMQALTSQLSNLIRYPGIRNIICNKYNNINYDNALKNGEVILVCTRRGDLGSTVHKGFGLFFLLLMQHSVLSRPGTERTRIPHFLYIDEFPPFICRATSEIFTLYRKYRVGTTISAQNLSQFGVKDGRNYRQTLLANCNTKIVFGNNTPEDNAWWEKELGEKREWKWVNDYHTEATIAKEVRTGKDQKAGSGDGFANTGSAYDSNYKNISYAWKENYAAGKVQALKFKQILYKTKDLKGKNIVGKAKVDFLESRYKDEEQKNKQYNFSKFIRSVQMTHDDDDESSKRFDLKNISFKSKTGNPNDFDPIINNNQNLNYSFGDADAITDYKVKKKTIKQNIDDDNDILDE